MAFSHHYSKYNTNHNFQSNNEKKWGKKTSLAKIISISEQIAKQEFCNILSTYLQVFLQ